MKNEKIHSRFEGLEKDYNLFLEIFPHYGFLEANIGQSINGYFNEERPNSISCLDIGCGTGFTTRQILEYNPDISILAIDESEKMVSLAKKNLSSFIAGGSKIGFANEDALSFLKNMKENSIDAVTSAFTLHNLENTYRSRVLEEIYRVLQPFGLFVNADIMYSDNVEESASQFQWLVNQIGKYEDIGRHDLRELWTSHVIEDRNPKRILTHNRFVKELRKDGFSQVRNPIRVYTDSLYTAVK